MFQSTNQSIICNVAVTTLAKQKDTFSRTAFVHCLPSPRAHHGTSGSSGTDTANLAAFGSLAVLTFQFGAVPFAPTISIAISITRIVAKSRILTCSPRFADLT